MLNKSVIEIFTREQNDGRSIDTIQDTEGMMCVFLTPIGDALRPKTTQKKPLLFYKSQQKIIDNTPSHDVLLLRKARQKDQRPPPINIQKLKDPKVMRTFQQKVQDKFSLSMLNSNKIDLETFNVYSYKVDNKYLVLKKRKIKKGF